MKPVDWKSVSSTYWNWQVVSLPNGLMDASSSAVLDPTFDVDSESIETGGAVVNCAGVPFSVPSVLVATARKS